MWPKYMPEPPIPSLSIGYSVKLGWSPAINIVVILPDYEVKTTRARELLPSKYKPEDVVFNMQRVAVLPHALGQTYPDPSMTYHAMQDRVHQLRQSQLEAGLEKPINLTSASNARPTGYLSVRGWAINPGISNSRSQRHSQEGSYDTKGSISSGDKI